MEPKRRALWLGGALAAAIAIAVWSWSDSSAPAAASPNRTTRTAAAQGGTGPEDTGPVDVNLDALKAGRNAPQDGRRNPFRFGGRDAASGPTVPAPAVGAPQEVAPTPPGGPPPLPPIALKFIGVIERSDGTKVAILAGPSYTLYGQEGQTVDGRYRLLTIGVESLEIAHLDGSGRQTIRLTGQ
ncbi:MAG: hypothetical protein LC791_02825 [Acidobacteria bacterium]|nr:hypothetical protein [Acidobacteriota bacterium]